MAKRSLAGSQFVPKELSDAPDIKFNVASGVSIEAKFKLTAYKPNDFGRDLNKAVKQANQIIADRIGEALDAAMESSAWPSGKDIIDTGELKNSLNVTATSRGINIKYSTPYAALVHYGGYIVPYGNQKLEKVYIPGRPWIDSVTVGGGPVEKFDFESIYREAITSIFG